MRSLPRISVENPVLAGMATALLLVWGAISAMTLVREMFPESRPNAVLISAPYPGATPLEVERGLALRIEEAVKLIKDIDRIITDINEGSCVITVELTSNVKDVDQKVNEFKSAIDAIPRDELPELAEQIRVFKSEPRLPVIAVTIFGDLEEAQLKALGERLRADLLRLPGVSDVALGGTRKAELTVEADPERLVAYGLSLSEVSAAVRSANLDLPGGQVKTADHNISLRTLGETDDAERIAETVVRAAPDGRLVRIRDIGRVIDGFEDRDTRGQFNGQPAVSCTVFKTADQDAVSIADHVKAFVAGKRGEPPHWSWMVRLRSALGGETSEQRVYRESLNAPYPGGADILTHSNLARFIEDRLELLTRNGLFGLALVFLSLLLFLNWRVAFWVMAGLVLSVCGAIIMMKLIGATLNLISMFGLIVVLGMLVDDAIIVGENIFLRVENGEDPRTAAIRGAEEVSLPVLVTITTTIGAFLPLMFIEGRIGDFMGVLPLVVMCALTVSLVESLLVLPSHLAESLKPVRPASGGRKSNWVARLAAPLRRAEEHLLMDPLAAVYARVVRKAVEYRYVTFAAAAAALLLALGFVAGGRVPVVFIQKMDSETLLADLDMPVGTPAERTREALAVVERAAMQDPEVRTVWAVVGGQLDADEGGAYMTERSHLAQLIIELKTVDQRDRSSDEIIADMRDRTADIPGINSLRYRSMQGGPAGREIEVEITSDDMDDVLAATRALREQLAGYDGVFDLADDYDEGRREIRLELLDSARPLDLTTRWLATEVRGAFYGLEARTIQRGREDIDIRVRFPESRRRNIYELEQMRIATPAGHMVPLCEIARLEEGHGPSAIRRVDQRRAVTLGADIDQTRGNAEQIAADLRPLIADLEARHPGLRIEFGGNQRELARSFGSLKRDFFIALLLIYAMLAVLFKSYIQPLIVMLVVPFGLTGAIVGHLFMGYPVTIMSMIGIVALTGIVVNDSLILIDFVNKRVAAGLSRFDAVLTAAQRRLRPILLTSVTTVLGLAPMMLETSFQARFLIPMAVSVSFGLAFSTLLTLLVIPAGYMVMEDAKAIWKWLRHGQWSQAITGAAATGEHP